VRYNTKIYDTTGDPSIGPGLVFRAWAFKIDFGQQGGQQPRFCTGD
jgi:hypothetical protein